MIDRAAIEVIAPNFKRRLSGVTATVVRLVPVQARDIAIVATGPVLPPDMPQIPLRSLAILPRRGPGPGGWRVWHARRNIEMIGGLILRYALGKRLKLMFTSASQRHQTWLTRFLIRHMDAVVATSDKTASYLEVPSQIVMHGVDTDGFSPATDRAALRRSLGLPEQGPLIGCYGRIRAQKGTDVYVDAMIALLARHGTATAIVMGRATDKHKAFEQDLRDRVRNAGLDDRIRFLPEVPPETMAQWYQILDLYISPQRWEGFGLTPIEAMATGCPVIATRVGAFEALIVEDATGLLVDPGDVEAMYEAADRVLSDPAKLTAWRANARVHVTQNFSIRTEAQALIRIYRRLLDDA